VNPPKFKVGDRVYVPTEATQLHATNPIYCGKICTIRGTGTYRRGQLVEYQMGPDGSSSWVAEELLASEAVYNSPLFKALK
jgi:hypothetical protein